jgi:hypothetical protein
LKPQLAWQTQKFKPVQPQEAFNKHLHKTYLNSSQLEAILKAYRKGNKTARDQEVDAQADLPTPAATTPSQKKGKKAAR